MKLHFESGENDNPEMCRIECETSEEFEVVNQFLASHFKREDSDVIIGNFKPPIFKNARVPLNEKKEY